MKRIIFFIAIAMSMNISHVFAQQENTEKFIAPLDGIVEKTLTKERRVLPYASVREADVFWEKRVWRVIDTREKINLPFRYERRPFFDIIVDNIKEGKIQAYAVNDQNDFTEPLSKGEVDQLLFTADTFSSFDPVTYIETIEIAYNEIDFEKIKRFRTKEVWYFDENTSTMKSRILGIAPLLEIYDSQDNFLYELPMFWIYYPQAREPLAREIAFNYGNDNSPMTWYDVFEMRMFSSYIYKESNVFDRMLQGYLSGVDLLNESKKINDEIFNFEHDLWEF